MPSIERLDPDTLKTNLIPFDLGKLVLQHDASQDLELQPGDVSHRSFRRPISRCPLHSRPSWSGWTAKFVHAGVYSVQPGETLRHLVERAGGFTPNAYLYASEFTRESTRAVQQARIDEYVQSLSLQSERSDPGLAASPTSSSRPWPAGAAAQSSEQNLLASLRQIRATGRIVLPFQSTQQRRRQPSRISPWKTATVLSFRPFRPLSMWLARSTIRTPSCTPALAGGSLSAAGRRPNRDADRRHEFIIRADGEVVSRDMSKGPWGNEFNDLHIYPGDTIVVPEKVLKPSALYGVMNWSQMFSQFALGAAALNVIH